MGFVPYLRKSDPHTVIIDFNGLVTTLYELFERHLQCLNAREDAEIKQVSSVPPTFFLSEQIPFY